MKTKSEARAGASVVNRVFHAFRFRSAMRPTTQIESCHNSGPFIWMTGPARNTLGKITQRVMWNERLWNLTAPEALVSPPSETRRNGTPLDIRPLNDLVTQASEIGRKYREW